MERLIVNEPMNEPIDHPVTPHLEPGETIHTIAQAGGASLVVTDRRLAVAADGRIALNVPFQDLRRIQFDIERQRPATLVIVPERPADEPQVITVPPQRYGDVAMALALVGERIYELG
jgi:hypothetical protein